jgi:hypothetical protein
MSKGMDYWVENEFRSLQDIRECAMKKSVFLSAQTIAPYQT